MEKQIVDGGGVIKQRLFQSSTRPQPWLVLRLVGISMLAIAVALISTTHARGQDQPLPTEQQGAYDAKELALKITDPFTIATAGDIIAPQPISNRTDPGFQSLIRVIHDADVGFANMESSLVDFNHRDQFMGPLMGTVAPKEVGTDIKAMGFTIVNRANNHALDGAAEGMISTDQFLDELGIVHAGSGKNLNEARAARFLATPKGRVGLVGMYSIDSSITENGAQYIYMSATYRVGDTGGRPGVDPLRLTTYHVVTPEQFQALKAVRDAYQRQRANEPADQMQIFNNYYKTGGVPGSISYEMNQDDEREILRSIRNGKAMSDFMIATVHAHHGAQQVNGVRTVSDFLVKLAHDCIDNGADIFVTHGPHELQGVEIYRGKPIFYGVSAFVFQSDLQLSSSNKDILFAPPDERPNCCTITANRAGQEGLLGESHYEGGRLVEVRLHPVDLGIGGKRPMSRAGLPTTPSPELTKEILEEMQTLSKPFGTKITIENGVGVIHVASSY